MAASSSPGRTPSARHGRSPAARRRLVVPYDLASFSPMQIAESADDLCEIVWVVDRATDDLGTMGSVLSRLGTVVDVGTAVDQGTGVDPGGGVDPGDRSLEGSLDELARLAPAGVVTFSQSKLLLAGRLAAGLGLPFNDHESLVRCVDKHVQRCALGAAGVEGPRFAEIEVGAAGELLAGDPSSLGFPAVLKPRRGSGSLDTFLVADAEALAALFDPVPDVEPIAAGSYLLEEYLEGVAPPSELAVRPVADYVSVESVVVDGKSRHLATTGKFPLAEPFRETGNFMPSLLSETEEAAVGELATRAIAALGATWGCLHIEIKLTPAGPRVIEVNPRIGGGGISELFELRSGMSLMRLAMLVALGESPPPLEPAGQLAYALFLQPPMWASQLKAIAGLAEAARVKGVRWVAIEREPPRPLDWRSGSQGYVASALGLAADHAELIERRAELLTLLRPTYG